MSRYTALAHGRIVSGLWLDGRRMKLSRVAACDTDEGWVDVYLHDGERFLLAYGDQPGGGIPASMRLHGRVTVEVDEDRLG